LSYFFEFSDHEYPHRVAHTLITKVLNDFCAKVPISDWDKDESLIIFNDLPALLAKYQNPREADAMTKMQDDLDETKVILVSHFLGLTSHIGNLAILLSSLSGGG